MAPAQTVPTDGSVPGADTGTVPFDRVGDAARAAGLVAVVVLLVPVVGDVVAVVAGLIAVVLGLVGVRRYESGRAARPGAAVLGVALGTLAVLAVVLLWVMTNDAIAT